MSVLMEKDAQIQLYGVSSINAQWQPGKWVDRKDTWATDLLIYLEVEMIGKRSQALM